MDSFESERDSSMIPPDNDYSNYSAACEAPLAPFAGHISFEGPFGQLPMGAPLFTPMGAPPFIPYVEPTGQHFVPPMPPFYVPGPPRFPMFGFEPRYPEPNFVPLVGGPVFKTSMMYDAYKDQRQQFTQDSAPSLTMMLTDPAALNIPRAPSETFGMPSQECINWMFQRFWERYNDMGRTSPLNRKRFHQSSGDSPLFWIVLWGASLSTDDVDAPAPPDWSPLTKSFIVQKARLALVAGLEKAVAELASASANRPSGLALARLVVPVLSGLCLGIVFSEKAKLTRHMLALCSLAVRFAVSATSALRPWMDSVSDMLREDRTVLSDVGDDVREIVEWMDSNEISQPFPIEESLRYRSISPQTFATLTPAQKEEAYLLTEFSGTFFYATGISAWSTDVVGMAPLMSSAELATIGPPIPFDGRGFEPSRYRRARQTDELDFVMNPVVPWDSFVIAMEPHAEPELRAKIFRATITDSFRVGPHFLGQCSIDLGLRAISLRYQAKEMGFHNLYPDAFNRSPALRAENLRLRQLGREVWDALPPELLKWEAEGQVQKLMSFTQTCPTWTEYSLPMLLIITSVYDLQTALRTPPPGTDPAEDWYQSKDGIEAGSYCLLLARFLRHLLDAGYDVNSHLTVRWIHTFVDRLARILFLHQNYAEQRGLPSQELFEQGLGTCMRWFAGLKGQERYEEWSARLERASLSRGFETSSHSGNGTESELDGSAVISALDKALASFRGAMNVDDAVLSLIQIGMDGARDD